MILYHISHKSLGKQPTLKPRTPFSRACGEDDTPRICVSPTIEECYLALQLEIEAQYVHRIQSYWVYVVDTRDSVFANESVFDRRITRERWLLTPTKLKRIGRIPAFSTGQRFMFDGDVETSKHVRWVLKRMVSALVARHIVDINQVN